MDTVTYRHYYSPVVTLVIIYFHLFYLAATEAQEAVIF